jgi:hypothetical protein
MLRDSGIGFVEVPAFERKQPSTSFKQAGRSRFDVDLLVPSPDETFPVTAVPELKAHATGLPYLGYLLAESQPAMLMARQGCCAIRIPLPESIGNSNGLFHRPRRPCPPAPPRAAPHRARAPRLEAAGPRGPAWAPGLRGRPAAGRRAVGPRPAARRVRRPGARRAGPARAGLAGAGAARGPAPDRLGGRESARAFPEKTRNFWR